MNRCLLMIGIAILASGPTCAAPLAVAQSTPRNVATVIQQKNPIITIDRNVTLSNGRTTVTEITQIGPDPVPVQIRQSGSANLVRSIQQGSNPSLDLQQSGGFNRALVLQKMIP